MRASEVVSPSTPTISVILPTRNRAAMLRRSVASVLAQTYRDFELIVVNDASTDDTAATLALIDDPRLRVVHRQANRGAAAARNAGVAAARGSWLSFQDDDDLWLVQRLERQLAFVRSCGARWCLAGHLRLMSRRTQYVGGAHYISQLDFRLGNGGGPDWSLIATPGWLVEKSLFAEAGGFDERFRSWDDWELGLRLAQISPPAVIDEPLWVQDWINGQGLMRLERARADDMRIIMDKHAALWRDSRRITAGHWYVVGRSESLYDPPPAGRTMLRRTIRTWPLMLRAWVALAMSYVGPTRAQALTMLVRRLRGGLQ